MKVVQGKEVDVVCRDHLRQPRVLGVIFGSGVYDTVGGESAENGDATQPLGRFDSHYYVHRG